MRQLRTLRNEAVQQDGGGGLPDNLRYLTNPNYFLFTYMKLGFFKRICGSFTRQLPFSTFSINNIPSETVKPITL